MMFKVYGDYGYVSETLLFETASLSEAVQWAKNYTRFDMGGFNVVEVARFLDDGEYTTEWVISYDEAEEFEDWDYEGVLHEE